MAFVCVKPSYTYLRNSFTYLPINLPLPLYKSTPFLLTFLRKIKEKNAWTNVYLSLTCIIKN